MQFKKYVFILFIIIVPFICSSQIRAGTSPKSQAIPEIQSPEDLKKLTPEQLKWLKQQLSKEEVEKTLEEVKNKFIKPKSDSVIYSTEISSYAGIFSDYSKNPNIEKETKIYREWYRKIGEGLNALANLSMKTETAKMNNQQVDISKLKTETANIQTKLETILKNPSKIPQNKTQKR